MGNNPKNFELIFYKAACLMVFNQVSSKISVKITKHNQGSNIFWSKYQWDCSGYKAK